jgi:myosin heavy subunit
MKTILIICTLGIIVSCSIETTAQSNLGKLRRVERLEKEKSKLEKSIQEKEKEIAAQKEIVREAAKKVDDEIKRQENIGKKNPKSHGTMKELNDRRENLEKEEAKQKELEQELEDLKEELETLQKKLDKAKADLEKALQDAENDVLKKQPLPEDPDELKKYKEEIDSWNNDGWNNDFGRKLKKRLKDKITGILKAREESSMAPSNHRGYFEPKGSLNAGWEPAKNETPVTISLGVSINDYTAKRWTEVEFQNFQQDVYSDPNQFSELMEELGGEFEFGTFSGPARLHYSDKSPEVRMELEMAKALKNRFSLALGIAYAQKNNQASFPLTVFGTESGNIQTAQGELQQTIHNVYLQPSLIWCPGSGKLKPNISVGPTLLVKTENASLARIGEWEKQLTDNRTFVKPGARMRAGIKLELSNQFFLQATANVAILSSGWQKGIQIMGSFKF